MGLMTREQREYVGKLLESGVSSLPEMREEMEGRFGERFMIKAIQRERSAYLLERIGSVHYSQKKIAAYQAFDRGETVDDAAKCARCTREVALDYYRSWKLRGGEAMAPSKRGTDGIRIGGGAVFGTATRRHTIWRAS